MNSFADDDESVPWHQYRTEIKSVKIDKGVAAGNSICWMFYGCNKMITADVANLDVSNTQNIKAIFSGCSSLINLDIGNWNVSNVTNMASAFQLCSSLTHLDIGNWDTKQVTNMNHMFYHCDSLKIFNARRWNTEKATNAEYMFRDCKALNQLFLSSNITSKIREQLPSHTWMHIQYLDGTKTHDYGREL